MDFFSTFAKVVALIGGAALVVRKIQGVPQVAAWGQAPAIPDAKPIDLNSTVPADGQHRPALLDAPHRHARCGWRICVAMMSFSRGASPAASASTMS